MSENNEKKQILPDATRISKLRIAERGCKSETSVSVFWWRTSAVGRVRWEITWADHSCRVPSYSYNTWVEQVSWWACILKRENRHNSKQDYWEIAWTNLLAAENVCSFVRPASGDRSVTLLPEETKQWRLATDKSSTFTVYFETLKPLAILDASQRTHSDTS